MNIEKMREEFEALAEQHFMLRERYLYWVENEEEYDDPDVQLAYEFFLMSRESLVIELPDPVEVEVVGVGCTMYSEYFDVEAVEKAIEATGARIKP